MSTLSYGKCIVSTNRSSLLRECKTFPGTTHDITRFFSCTGVCHVGYLNATSLGLVCIVSVSDVSISCSSCHCWLANSAKLHPLPPMLFCREG